MNKRRVAVVSTYFDTFSGYQEISLAKALAKHVEVTVFAGRTVSPIFSDTQLANIGIQRSYSVGRTLEDGVEIVRLPSIEFRSMVWLRGLKRSLERTDHDIIVQLMPGTIGPISASFVPTNAPRITFYGDNSAMYADLHPILAKLKFMFFTATKGIAYWLTNRRATRVYGLTPETITRLKPFRAGKTMELAPLVFDPDEFFYSPEERRAGRSRLGLSDHSRLVAGVGKINHQKRFDLLVEAFEVLAREDSTLHLAILGLSDNEASKKLRRRVACSEYIDRIALLPFGDSEDLRKFFNAADVAVWPRMPAITIQQAMGTGLRVVLPANDTVSHLIRSKNLGSYFDDAEDAQSAMTHALRNVLTMSLEGRQERVQSNRWLSSQELAMRILNADA